jgi:hypothetical protein
MDYTQRNHVPLPAAGAFQSVPLKGTAVFDWQYSLDQPKLLQLYEKGKKLAWNATDLDWTTPVDAERLGADENLDTFMNHVLKPPRTMSKEDALLYHVHTNSFMLSQFLHGEQGALLAAAKIVQTVPWEEAKFYAANQVADEARHVEVYHRYLTEKLGISYEIHPSLAKLLEDITTDSRWDITYLGMQIMVEGLALAAFGIMRLVMQHEPLILDITTRIMADEARHVGFGVLSLQNVYSKEMSSAELREREDFVIEATRLMHKRLVPTPVFERLGWDLKVWVPWVEATPFHKGFRQMMFSKIVPNLKRLGLLTPPVRAAMQDLDLLRFENDADSIESPEVTPPAELVQLIMEGIASGAMVAPH